MTIDSAYQLELYSPDNDREYFFEFESIGATTFALWVDYVFDGVAYRDSPGTFAYEIEFEGRGPIYKRGKITLTDDFYLALAGAEITRLTMQRKTPIFKDVTFEANGEWSSEGFEFEIDKICMIQQEIEGHYCDCREKEQGLAPIENVVEEEYYEQFPECGPYACDAIKQAAIATGTYYWPADNMPSDGNLLAGYENTPDIPVASGTFILLNGVWLDGGCSENEDFWSYGPSVQAPSPSVPIEFGPNFNMWAVIRPNASGGLLRMNRNYVKSAGVGIKLQVGLQLTSNELFIDIDFQNTHTGTGRSSDYASISLGTVVTFPSKPFLVGMIISAPESIDFPVGGVATPISIGYEVFAGDWVSTSGVAVLSPAVANTQAGEYFWDVSGVATTHNTIGVATSMGNNFSDFVINADATRMKTAWAQNKSGYEPPEYCLFPRS